MIIMTCAHECDKAKRGGVVGQTGVLYVERKAWMKICPQPVTATEYRVNNSAHFNARVSCGHSSTGKGVHCAGAQGVAPARSRGAYSAERIEQIQRRRCGSTRTTWQHLGAGGERQRTQRRNVGRSPVDTLLHDENIDVHRTGKAFLHRIYSDACVFSRGLRKRAALLHCL